MVFEEAEVCPGRTFLPAVAPAKTQIKRHLSHVCMCSGVFGKYVLGIVRTRLATA